MLALNVNEQKLKKVLHTFYLSCSLLNTPQIDFLSKKCPSCLNLRKIRFNKANLIYFSQKKETPCINFLLTNRKYRQNLITDLFLYFNVTQTDATSYIVIFKVHCHNTITRDIVINIVGSLVRIWFYASTWNYCPTCLSRALSQLGVSNLITEEN